MIYDSEMRVKLWNAMMELIYLKMFIEITKPCGERLTGADRIEDQLFDLITMNNDLKQDEPLYPLFFNREIEIIIGKINIKTLFFR